MKEIAGDFAFQPECGGIDLSRACCVLIAPSDSRIWLASSCPLSARTGHSCSHLDDQETKALQLFADESSTSNRCLSKPSDLIG